MVEATDTSSSTTITFFPSPPAINGPSMAFWEKESNSMGILRVKVDPSPSRLSAVSLPASNQADFFAMARPRPVPSNCLEEEPSTWRNSSKIKGSSSFGIPMPVSFTLMTNSPPSFLTEMATPPSGVNLTALSRRFLRICLSLESSVFTSGRSFGISASRKISFSMATGLRVSRSEMTVSLREKSEGLISTRPDSIFERSRISFIRSSNCLPFLSITSRYFASSSSFWPPLR